MTTSEKLVGLSRLGLSPAGTHLRAIGVIGVTASSLLRAKSPLGSATAAQHLLAIQVVVPVVGKPRITNAVDDRPESVSRVNLGRYGHYSMPR